MSNPLEALITRADIADLAEQENLILDDDERISVLEAMRSIDVQACPGSGKTTLIAAKLILLAKKWPYRYRGICVLSHTNVAKDEIIAQINRSKAVEARNLLTYPHFIGTIQEFINKFLALPVLRSSGLRDITVDNDEYIKVAGKLLQMDQFKRFRGILKGLGPSERIEGFLRRTFRLCVDGGAEVYISMKPQQWKKHENHKLKEVQGYLRRLKQYLDERGFYLFRDMYTHAQIALNQNQALASAVISRFPCVFIDEVQDTQKFQDELLGAVFVSGKEALMVQRFGDPDQAIFHGIGADKSNESFNGKSRDEMDFVIHKSHRFDRSIADKIKPLSFNEVPLETELTDEALEHRADFHSSGGPFRHTVIVFSDETRERVIEQFAQIVSDQFSYASIQSDKFSVKVVGAVGNKIDPAEEELKIGHYWGDYDKSKSKTNFKERTLIEAARYCRGLSEQDWAQSYLLFFDCVLKLLRMADIFDEDENERHFTASRLREKLIVEGNWKRLREGILLVLGGEVPLDQDVWEKFCNLVKEVCWLGTVSEEIENYLSFEEEQSEVSEQNEEGKEGQVLEALRENRIRHQSGFEIQLSTIHGVKGETHDATLILETKYYEYNVSRMLPFLCGDPKGGRSKLKTRDIQLMRQLYVAASRPKHLLCLALYSDRLAEAGCEQALRDRGWKIERL